ncbi:MAG: hypothetical protein ACW992_01275, partial [Candidatus Thorarchaeota archaeon]
DSHNLRSDCDSLQLPPSRKAPDSIIISRLTFFVFPVRFLVRRRSLILPAINTKPATGLYPLAVSNICRAIVARHLGRKSILHKINSLLWPM